MKDLLGLMGKAREMQDRFQNMQEEITTLEAVGQSGGGLVKVTLTGKFNMSRIEIDPSLLKDDDAGIVEDLIMAAYNDAKGRIEVAIEEKAREMTAGLPVPPGFKLPF